MIIFPILFVIEVSVIIAFFALIFGLFKKKKGTIVFFFVLPFIFFQAFIELMSIHVGGNFSYSQDQFILWIYGLSPVVLMAWTVAFYFSYSLTNRVWSHIRVPIFFRAVADALFVTSLNIIANPILTRYGWIRFNENQEYFINGSLLGVPVWEFIGSFLAIFLFSFGYRMFEKLESKKRLIFVYGYIFTILGARFLVYFLD